MLLQGWYETALFSITSISVLLQGYVFFLILKVSPKSMTTYCFFLICYTFWDMSFTILIGYGLILDMQAPSMCGGYVNGFAKYFGSNGGNTVISVMAFSAAALIYYMLYGLSYRYLAVQTDRRWIEYFLRPISFVLLNILGLLISLGVAISVYSATTKPELCL